jgi:lysine-specific demethylase 8
MASEVWALPWVACGSFRATLQETNFWLSSGDTVSALHADADNIVNCVLQGTKRWVLMDPRHKRWLYMNSSGNAADDVGGALQKSDFSDVNPVAVDMDVYGDVARAPWSYAAVRAGDCLYLPPGYVHQVRSPPGRNMAAAMMFMSLRGDQAFEEDPRCLAAARAFEERRRAGRLRPNETSPLAFSELPFPWKFSGHGRVPMGYVDPEDIRQELLTLLLQHPDGLALPRFRQWYLDTGAGPVLAADAVFRLLVGKSARHDPDKRPRLLTARRVLSLPRDTLRRIALMSDEPAGLEQDLAYRRVQ